MSKRQRALEKPDGLRVTKLELHPAGFWTANVSLNGQTVRVTNKHGSWHTVPKRGENPQFVMPNVAAELQAQVATETERRANGTSE